MCTGLVPYMYILTGKAIIMLQHFCTSFFCHRPAYERYHSLAQPTQSPSRSSPPPTDLPLPYNYQVLAEKFRCTDTVTTMLQKRREICTFDKLKPAVQEMTRR